MKQEGFLIASLFGMTRWGAELVAFPPKDSALIDVVTRRHGIAVNRLLAYKLDIASPILSRLRRLERSGTS